MAKISGVDGALTISGGTTFVLTKFDIEQTCGIQDVTDSSSSSWREKIPNGFSEWKGSAEGFLSTGTAAPVTGAAAAECVFTAETGTTWTGNAIITRVSNALQVGGDTAVTCSIDLEGTGALTAANAA